MGRSDFWTMKEIGGLFGVTSHVIGKTLKRLSLRTPEGKPSRLAFDLDLVEQRWSLDAYTWVWNLEKTVPLLEQVGLERVREVTE